MEGEGGVKGESGSEGRDLGKAEWEREGEREGRQGELGTEGGRGGSGKGGWSPRLGLSFNPGANPAGISKILRQGHASLGFGVPALGGFPEVSSSEPAVGTYPHNRFHMTTLHVNTHARSSCKGQSSPSMSLILTVS